MTTSGNPETEVGKLRVGTLTFHSGTNHGAFLQALFLQKSIENLGHSANVINFVHPIPLARERLGFLLNRSPKTVIDNLRKLREFQRANEALNLSPKSLISSPKSLKRLSDDYDVVVIGSDVVWAYEMKELGPLDHYFGVGLASHVRLISYAASMGPSGIDAPPPGYLDGLKTFTAVSVRDENTRETLARHGIASVVVTDPTLLIDLEDLFPSQKESIFSSESPYVVIYAAPLPPKVLDFISGWAKERGMKVKAIGYPQTGLDRAWVAINPRDWVEAIKGASFVFTNSYHGTIFSILSKTPFVTLDRTPIRNKALHLLSSLALSERYRTDSDLMTFDFDSNPDWELAFQNIAVLRKRSLKFLEEALCG